MKTNYLHVVQDKLLEAAEAHAHIPFRDCETSITLHTLIAKALLETKRLEKVPQDGTSLADFMVKMDESVIA